MNDFFDEQGRARISFPTQRDRKAYNYVRRRRKSEENTAH